MSRATLKNKDSYSSRILTRDEHLVDILPLQTATWIIAREWISIIEAAYMLFASIELASYLYILFEYYWLDTDVRFYWSMLSTVNKEHIIELWLTIRGFSLASTLLEDYKIITKQIQAKEAACVNISIIRHRRVFASCTRTTIGAKSPAQLC